MNAVAILTDVSLTLHFSGFGGEVMSLGPPGCDKVEDFGGDREPRVGALFAA